MPVMDGLTAIKLIRAQPNGADVKIISLSASVFEEERKRFIDGGADAFMPKPVKEDELIGKICELMGLAPCQPTTLAGIPAAIATPEVVPPHVARAITEAAEMADYARMSRMIEELRTVCPSCAQELATHLRAFNYDAICERVRPRLP